MFYAFLRRAPDLHSLKLYDKHVERFSFLNEIPLLLMPSRNMKIFCAQVKFYLTFILLFITAFFIIFPLSCLCLRVYMSFVCVAIKKPRKIYILCAYLSVFWHKYKVIKNDVKNFHFLFRLFFVVGTHISVTRDEIIGFDGSW